MGLPRDRADASGRRKLYGRLPLAHRARSEYLHHGVGRSGRHQRPLGKPGLARGFPRHFSRFGKGRKRFSKNRWIQSRQRTARAPAIIATSDISPASIVGADPSVSRQRM